MYVCERNKIAMTSQILPTNFIYKHKIKLAAITLLFALLSTIPADAQVLRNGTFIDEIMGTYQAATGGWFNVIHGIAQKLFFSLVLLDLIWLGIRFAIVDGADIQQFFGGLVQRLFVVGAFLILLQFDAIFPQFNSFADMLISSFRKAGGLASGVASGKTDLNAIWTTGLNTSLRIMNSVSLFDGGSTILGKLICSLVILISYALIISYMMLAIIEMYVVTSAGVILLGFGGHSLTREYAMKYVTYAFSVGMKLFMIQIIVTLGNSSVVTYLALFTDIKTKETFGLMIIAIIFVALIINLPSLIQSLISGIAGTHHGGVASAAKAVLAPAAAAAAAAAGGTMAAAGALSAAAKASAASGNGSAGDALKRFGGAMGASMKDKAFGMPGAQYSSTGGLARSKIQGEGSGFPSGTEAAVASKNSEKSSVSSNDSKDGEDYLSPLNEAGNNASPSAADNSPSSSKSTASSDPNSGSNIDIKT